MRERTEDRTAAPRTFVDVLGGWAHDEVAGKTAFTFMNEGEEGPDARLTYAGLDHRARALAARLRSLGLEGERALLVYPPGLDFVAAFFGCL